jgi:hypothetical protein
MDHQAFAQLLGNYGEFVGAIAVVATLVYLAVQVRQSKESMDANTRALEEDRKLTRETMLFQLTDRWDTAEHLATETKTVTEILVRGNLEPDDLEEADRTIYEYRLGRMFNVYFMFHRLAEAGFLDEEITKFSDRHFQNWGATAGGRRWWSRYGNLFPEQHQQRVDALLRQSVEPG